MAWELAARFAATLVVAYLLGGVPWALIIGKRFYGIDVRSHGSGNLGATNVFRALGAKPAIATLLLDAAKGAAAVGLAAWFVSAATYGGTARTWAMIGATMAAMLGHSYSPYIGFRGGKGVATAAGAVLVLTPQPWAVLLAVFLVVFFATRIVSLGSIVIALGYPVMCFVFYPGDWTIIGFSCVAACLVVWRHRANIVRIWRHEESKIAFGGRGSAARKKGDS